MQAYKFLASGAVGRFSDFAWPCPVGQEPGEWVEAGAELEDCRNGIHACAPGRLLDWIDDELWEVELDGDIVRSEGMLVARRGRLLRRVTEWDAATAQAFAYACAWRARDHALPSLRRSGLADEAERLGEAAELHAVQSSAAAAFERSDGAAAELSAFAADAVSLAQGRRPEMWSEHRLALEKPVVTAGAIAANVAFIVAHAAARAAVAATGSASAYDDGFAAERAWQLDWLTGRLGLTVEA